MHQVYPLRRVSDDCSTERPLRVHGLIALGLGQKLPPPPSLPKSKRSTPDPRPTFCSSCFRNLECLHQHTRFLRVTPSGEHVITQRPCGLAEARPLVLSEFPVVRDAWGEGKLCQSFCCDNEDLPVAPPGCPRGHGLPLSSFHRVEDKHLGDVDSGEHYCAPCFLAFVQAQARSECCGLQPSSYCPVCAQDAHTRSFVSDFIKAKQWIEGDGLCDEVFSRISTALATDVSREEVAAATATAGAVGELRAGVVLQAALKRLHPQPWLHVEIDML